MPRGSEAKTLTSHGNRTPKVKIATQDKRTTLPRGKDGTQQRLSLMRKKKVNLQ